MRLTEHTDYSLRVLVYLNQLQKTVTLTELAVHLRISRNNLIKVSRQLAKLGYIETRRGKSGGIVLHKDTPKVSLKEIVSHTEENMNIAGCFSGKNFPCTFQPACRLRKILKKSLQAFLDAMQDATLDDITPGKS